MSDRFFTFAGIAAESALSEWAQEAIAAYQPIIALVIDGKNLNGLSAQLLSHYLSDSAGGAQTYIDTLASQLSGMISSFSTRNVANGIIKYLQKQLSAIEIYNLHGCIVDDSIDYLGCELGVSEINLTLEHVLGERSDAEQTVRSNLPVLEQILEEQTDNILESLKGGENT